MGEILERPGRRAEVLVARDELVLFEFEMAPETDGAGPHFHEQHVDSFYVLEGEVELTVDGETVRARAGEFVHVPPGVVHSFRNAGAEHVRFLNLHTPGMRFDEHIRRMDAGDKPALADYDSFSAES
jgi:mannose-6-phosphate isomerase-like protein (cupin superfamily)